MINVNWEDAKTYVGYRQGGTRPRGRCRGAAPTVAVEGAPATGRMKIVLAGGRRVIVDRAVDGSALARVIAVLERR